MIKHQIDDSSLTQIYPLHCRKNLNNKRWHNDTIPYDERLNIRYKAWI